jgi:hypothetical protein
MTEERNLFISLELHDVPKETIIFGDSCKWHVIGLGKTAISHDTSITNVYLVESLDYNLLSVSQLYEKSFNCLFTNEGVTVFKREHSSIAFTGRLKCKLYLVDFSKD